MIYKKISKIQSGSFSVVYKGMNQETGEMVALKCIPKPIIPTQPTNDDDNNNNSNSNSNSASGKDNKPIDPRMITRQQNKLKKIIKLVSNEYEILLKLQKHPFICCMLDFFETNEYFVFVLEYCENGDLYDYIKLVRNRTVNNPNNVEPPPKLDFFKLVQQIVNALQYSHSLNISHRDIKPENILLDSQLNVKLTDWGLSYMGEYNTNACIGTEKYLSPESFYPGYVLRDESIEMNSILPNYITHLLKDPQLLTVKGYNCMKSDFWSLGITLLYTLFASCPFKYACLNNPQQIGNNKKMTQQQQQQQQQQQGNRNFQVFITNPMKFIDEYYFQSIIRQETMNSMYYSNKTIHATMNIPDEKNYPAFWLTLCPQDTAATSTSETNGQTTQDFSTGKGNTKAYETCGKKLYNSQFLETDKPFRIWMLHELAKNIVSTLLQLNFSKRNLGKFDEGLNLLWYSQTTVINNELNFHYDEHFKNYINNNNHTIDPLDNNSNNNHMENHNANNKSMEDVPITKEIMDLFYSSLELQHEQEQHQALQQQEMQQQEKHINRQESPLVNEPVQREIVQPFNNMHLQEQQQYHHHQQQQQQQQQQDHYQHPPSYSLHHMENIPMQIQHLYDLQHQNIQHGQHYSPHFQNHATPHEFLQQQQQQQQHVYADPVNMMYPSSTYSPAVPNGINANTNTNTNDINAHHSHQNYSNFSKLHNDHAVYGHNDINGNNANANANANGLGNGDNTITASITDVPSVHSTSTVISPSSAAKSPVLSVDGQTYISIAGTPI